MSLHSEIQVGTFLAYVPVHNGLDTDGKQAAYRWAGRLKQDTAMVLVGGEEFDPPIHTTDLIAREVSNGLPARMEELFFPEDATLVPIPRASLAVEEAMWVPDRFAHALVRHGLGRSVQRLLVRSEAVTRSSTAEKGGRPNAKKHFDTMAVTQLMPETWTLILIDDVLTKGSTALGAASRLKAAFPQADVRCFVAMNACYPDKFKQTRRPQIGTVKLWGMYGAHKELQDP